MNALTVKECDNKDAAIALIREYSTIKGAEKCFVSLDKELADLESYYKGGALLLGYEGDKPIATIAIVAAMPLKPRPAVTASAQAETLAPTLDS